MFQRQKSTDCQITPDFHLVSRAKARHFMASCAPPASRVCGIGLADRALHKPTCTEAKLGSSIGDHVRRRHPLTNVFQGKRRAMSHILAIESDRRRRILLMALIREHALADVTMVDTVDDAIASFKH